MMRAVEMSLWQRQVQNNMLLHSDRGTEFTSSDYRKLLTLEGLTSSMTDLGHCVEKSASEGFFDVVKRERISY